MLLNPLPSMTCQGGDPPCRGGSPARPTRPSRSFNGEVNPGGLLNIRFEWAGPYRVAVRPIVVTPAGTIEVGKWKSPIKCRGDRLLIIPECSYINGATPSLMMTRAFPSASFSPRNPPSRPPTHVARRASTSRNCLPQGEYLAAQTEIFEGERNFRKVGRLYLKNESGVSLPSRLQVLMKSVEGARNRQASSHFTHPRTACKPMPRFSLAACNCRQPAGPPASTPPPEPRSCLGNVAFPSIVQQVLNT